MEELDDYIIQIENLLDTMRREHDTLVGALESEIEGLKKDNERLEQELIGKDAELDDLYTSANEQ